VNVFVDCDWGRKNKDLSSRYNVSSYPTVIFTDAYGKLVEPMGGGDPASVEQQIQAAAKRGGGSPHASFEKAAEEAKRRHVPVLYLFTTAGRDSDALEDALFDASLESVRDSFVLASSAEIADNPDAKRFGVAALGAPVILVLDAEAEKPETAPLKRLVGKRGAKSILKELQSVLKAKKK
jgi:hypothetical protein